MTARTLRAIAARDLERELPAALANRGPALLPVPDTATPHDHPCHGMTVPEHIALVIETSGSMAKPKRVMLSAEALLAGAAATAEHFGVANGEQCQWLLALPEHYIAGVQVTVRALAAGSSPIRYTGERFDAEAFCQDAGRMRATNRFVSLVPAQLDTLLTASDTDRLDAVMRAFTAILVGGQAIPSALRAAAAERNWPLVATYGASETAGGIAYDAKPLPGVRVRAVNGELQIASPTLADGYLADAVRTADRFITERGVRWYRTGDAGRVNPDGTISVYGRLDNVVMSGGVKVNLDEVERAVADAAQCEVVAVAVEDARWGQRVGILARVAADGDLPRRAETPQPVRIALAPFGPAALPVVWAEHDTIPRLASGKPDRTRIRNLVARIHNTAGECATDTAPA